jgi:hypothetical protein
MWLLLGWITVPLLVFSIAQTKHGWYIGMVYPAVALLLALALTELLTARLAFGVLATVMAVCCIRLPVGVEGARSVRPFAEAVAHHVARDETIYVFERLCEPRGLSLPNITVVLTQLITQSMLHDSCSGNTWPRADATGASGTMRTRAGQSAARPGLAATVAAESRARSAGGKATAGLERRQAAPCPEGWQAFF